VLLPAIEESFEADEVQAYSEGNAGESANRSAGPQRGTVLRCVRVFVVDDEDDTRDLMTVVLKQHGAEVKSFGTAPEALAAIEDARPDVLVSDIGMPHEDGYSLIKKLRRHENQDLGTLPALALTAYASVEDRRRALDAGFQLHLAKPVYPDQLVEAVASLAGKNGDRPQPSDR
jgi:CheY-like chemotaxis protein